MEQVSSDLRELERLESDMVLHRFESDIRSGLSEEEAGRRLQRHGPNALEEKKEGVFKKVLSYFWGPIPWMIEVAVVLSALLRHWTDLAIIVAMLLINALVAFFEEHKADNAIALLKERLAPSARVLRGGGWREIPARELVPGDVVSVKLGNIIPADLKLIEGEYLSVDQSALTGESLPVDKGVGDLAYSGSIAKLGEMVGVVVETGMNTYFGRTARLVESARVTSHFQRAVLRIGNFLILSTIVLILVILGVAVSRHAPVLETLQFALILTVASIPVALPAVLSVTMAVGAEKLARMKAIVSRLVSIEELAGMDVLCSDKTGTLTKNELTLGEPVPAESIEPQRLLLAAALASYADNPDAIDSAVLEAAGVKAAIAAYRVTRFEPFDPVHKRAVAHIIKDNKTFRVAKGAPQVILDMSEVEPEEKGRVEKQVKTLAAEGYRTLGVAEADDGGVWRFLGLLPLFDPPREDSAATIGQAARMGVGVKMITGDHEAIARQIAAQLDMGANIVVAGEVFGKKGTRPTTHDMAARIEACDGIAEVFPEHKFEIVRTLQSVGCIVGMTGDGVNDAPALKQADVGIAVSGATDAARAAADVVLTAPGLSVIVSGIEEARRIFSRMMSYAVFRIAETIRVLLFMTLSIVVFNFYPVTAIMIVLLALLNDFPIMMIAYDNTKLVERPVRWKMERVLTIASTLGMIGLVESFLLFWFAEDVLKLPQEQIQTLIFLKLLVAGHLTIYITRSLGPFWERPWPNVRLFVTTEATQILGTLATVYGWFVEPIGWRYALAVWAYALVWLLINDAAKLGVGRLLDHRARLQARHLARVERHVAFYC